MTDPKFNNNSGQEMLKSKTVIQCPDTIKAAARAVSQCRFAFYESADDPCGGPNRGDGSRYNGVSAFSMHDVLIWLCRAGLPVVLSHIDFALSGTLKETKCWEEVLAFFLANPTAREARRVDFPPGSEAGKHFIAMDGDAKDGDEDEKMTVTRKEALAWHAAAQYTAMELSEAKVALELAINTARTT